MLHTKSELSKMTIEALNAKAKELKITLTEKETKKSLIEKIMLLNEPVTAPKPRKARQDKQADAPVKNHLSVRLNGEVLQEFNITGRNVTTIERFFTKYGLLADSTKDTLLIEVNGHVINYFDVRKKLNKLIASQFVAVTQNAVYDPVKKIYVNEKDQAVKDATAYIKKAVGFTYEHINDFLTMNAKTFREKLAKDEVFAEIINSAPLSQDSKNLLLPA